ncbi:unnamed protein product, partial [Effrenium voratum]
MGARCIAAVGFVALGVAAAPAGHQRGPGDSWLLPSHSFERTIHDETWLLSAASMAMQDRVLLMPPVADRAAFMWNKKAIDSTDFEVVFTISGRLPRGTDQDGIFAFWLSLEDYAKQYDEKAIIEKAQRDRNKDWKVGLRDAGFSQMGSKPDFKGLAIVFLPFDGQRKLRQTVAALVSDGSKAMPAPLEEVLKDSRATVVTSDWLPSSSSSCQVRLHPDGSIVIAKRDLGVSHLPGSLWSWAPDGDTVKGTFVLQPDNTLSWKEHAKSGSWNLLPGGKLNMTLFEANFILRLEGRRAVQEYPEFPTRAIAYLGGKAEEEPWQQLMSFRASALPVPVPRTYLGFTGYSGTKTGMEVNLNYLASFNHDPHVLGE